jgi:ABC-2 type transport system permease protein
MIGRIARHEFRTLFATPAAWVFLALGQFLLAWLFLALVEQYQARYQPLLVKLNASLGATDLVAMPFLADPRLLMLLLLAAALLAMRLIAEERRQQTLPLLLAAPLSSTEIVLGKYLGAVGFALLLVALWGGMLCGLLLGTGRDLGRLLASLLGLLLLSASLFALALWVSALASQPAVAAVATFAGGLLLMLLQQGGEHGVIAYLSPLTHYERFLRGAVALADLAFFGVLIVGFLALAIRRLDALRVQA